MKFVRWFGAFRNKRVDTLDAGVWENTQTARQVAVEPLWHGRSLLLQSKIGLVVDHAASRFVKGWLTDAYTVGEESGILRPRFAPKKGGFQGQGFRDMNRFLKAWNAINQPLGHGEAVFDSPVYCAVVVKSSASRRRKACAKDLANALCLPLVILGDKKI